MINPWLFCLLNVFLTAPVLAAADSCTVLGDYRATARTNMIAQGQPSLTRFQLSGQLIYRPLKQTDSYAWLGFELYEPVAKADGEAVNSVIYSIPFAVKIDRQQGRILDYVINADLNASDAGKLQGFYRSFYIHPPNASDDPTDYRVQDRDDLGVYLTHYQTEGDSVLRRREKYIDVGLPEGRQSLMKIKSVDILEDEAQIQSDGCWVSQASGVNDMRFKTDGKLFDVSIRQTFEMNRRQDKVPANARLLTLPHDPALWQPLDTGLIYPEVDPVPLQNADVFLSRFNGMDWASLPSEELLQFLFDNDQFIPLLKSVLLDPMLDDSTEKRLLLMLGKHDSNTAHALLTEVFVTEAFDSQTRFRSLMALKYSQTPLAPDLVESMVNYAMEYHDEENADLSHSALMVLGIIAKNQSDSDFGQQLSNTLSSELGRTSDVHQRAALLSALGNAADPEHQQQIQSYLGNDSPLLRQRSAQALASLPGEASIRALSNQLVVESNGRVQSAILTGLGANALEGPQLNQVYAFASESTDDKVRKAAIGALGKQLNNNPQVEKELRSLIKGESNKDNMRSILDALYGDR